MLSLYDRLFLTAREILLAIGTGLELKDPAFLKDFHSGINNQLRLLHYPPVLAKEIEDGEKVRLPAHTDWGSITMVWQDGCGGLEVEKPGGNGEFLSAEPKEGAVVVNVGDLLMRWSNGLSSLFSLLPSVYLLRPRLILSPLTSFICPLHTSSSPLLTH
jgi:isopenicillin N synthase-like dioxygenase